MTLPWETLADVILQRLAMLARIGDGLQPHDFAGMFVDHADVDRILAQLPGLDGPRPADLAPLLEATEPALTEARQRFEEALDAGESAFARLATAAGLDPSEAEVLALVGRVEMSPPHQRLVAYVQDAVALPRLTMATLRRLCGGVGAFGPASSLRRGELVSEVGDGPWASRMLAPAPRVTWALAGDRRPDPELPVGATTGRFDGAGNADLVVVSGADLFTRRAAGTARTVGGDFLVTPVPSGVEAWRALVREATIGGAGVVMEASRPLAPDALAHIDRAPHLTWVLTFPSEPPIESLPDRPWEEVRLGDGTANADDWASVAGVADGHGYRLDRTQLHHVAKVLTDGRDLTSAVRRLASGHLDDLAVRIRPRRAWADLVLPEEETAQLRELVARFRHRHVVYHEWEFAAFPSAGLVAVFAGPSGTGKTLAAEVIAADLGLDLYKVDLSAVVSKYIGETEKNLERIFDAAAAGEVVLFFDEADALFGKRSDVSDAHDRYANIEVAYLLQRLETYDGLVVLATNLQRNMDAAFLRRIHVAVEFPMPDTDQRRRIWTLAFPSSAPTGDLDLDFLSRQFKISGGSIRNGALTAAFLAADNGGSITMDTVMLGLKREFQKLGRLRTEADFDRYYDLVKDHAEPALT